MNVPVLQPQLHSWVVRFSPESLRPGSFWPESFRSWVVSAKVCWSFCGEVDGVGGVDTQCREGYFSYG